MKKLKINKLPLKINQASNASPEDNSNTKSMNNKSKSFTDENSDCYIIKASVDDDELSNKIPDNFDKIITLK